MKQLQYVLLACGLAVTAGIYAPKTKKKASPTKVATPAATVTDFAGQHIIMNGQALQAHKESLVAGLDSTDVAVYWKTLVKLYAELLLGKAYKTLALKDHLPHGQAFVTMATPLYNEIPAYRKTALTKAVAAYQGTQPAPSEDDNYKIQETYYKKLYEDLETKIPTGFTLATPAATPTKTVKAPVAKSPEAQFIADVKLALAKDTNYQALPDQKAKTAKMVLAGQVAAQWLQHSPHATAADKAKAASAIIPAVLKAPDGAKAEAIKVAPAIKPKGSSAKMSAEEVQANLIILGDALIALQQAAGIK